MKIEANSDLLNSKDALKSHPVISGIIFAGTILFICSSLRHWLYQSHGYDLGWFDQAVYLLSTGQNPIVSFGGFHILGDHAAIIFYPIALFYKIYPSVHWLFAIQAVTLAGAGLPLYYLSLQSGLNRSQAITIVFAYLLYPLVFNKSLFDFHAEVIAIPCFFTAVLTARSKQTVAFILAIIGILSCKAVLSLTVIAMGVWLLFCDRSRTYGAIAICLGLAWFIISSQYIIPAFSGTEPAAVSRYSYLGGSIGEIARNLIFKPDLVLGKIFSPDTLEYIAFLCLPVLWGLSPRHLAPLMSTIPMLMMNILSTASTQRNLVHQYSIPILPFLFLAIIEAVAADRGFLKTRRNILIWSAIAFILLSKVGYFWSTYLSSLDTNAATTIAIGKIRDSGAVLTTGEISPHLTHRPVIKLTFTENAAIDLQPFKYVLLNERHPGWNSNLATVQNIRSRVETSQNFHLKYKQDDVYLFVAKFK
jgi:uncharacterized membrane protein